MIETYLFLLKIFCLFKVALSDSRIIEKLNELKKRYANNSVIIQENY